MADKARKPRFTVRRTFKVVPAAEFDLEAVEDALARLIAEAYVADHPELFKPVEHREERRPQGE